MLEIQSATHRHSGLSGISMLCHPRTGQASTGLGEGACSYIFSSELKNLFFSNFAGEIQSPIEDSMEQEDAGGASKEKRVQDVLDLLDVSKNSKLDKNSSIQKKLQKLVLKSIQNTPDTTEIWQVSMFDKDG
ncbi:hypothetical protein HON22_02200 [Candidatus Peregrinibacteria bacterium]|jgi:hypothetical protein|nr:hypothetical protein [Candidatus Peregrinibacteria bacterium]